MTRVADKNNELDIELYKALYEFQVKQYDIARARYARYEDKALKHLTFTSIIITVVTLLAKHYLIDTEQVDKVIWDHLILTMLFVCFISLCVVVRNLLMVMRTTDVERLDTSMDMIDFFTKNDRSTVYYNLAIDFSEAIKSYEIQNTEKTIYLKKASTELRASGLIFIFAIIMILISNFMK